METEKSVLDGKLTNEQLGGLTRRQNEIIRRINDGTLKYDEAMALLQGFVIEAKSSYFGVLKGTHEIKVIEHLIDCDADPFIPESWEVLEHQKGGIVRFNASKIDLYLSKPQRKGNSIEGNKLREELKNKKVLNANVLDFLLKNPHLIPEDWKGKAIFFWGTIYCSSDGDLYVRYLSWFGGAWRWSRSWLDSGFRSGLPAAVSAS